MTFKTVQGSQVSQPLSVEYVGNMVFVRKNIHRVEVSMPDQDPVEMWEYEEAYCTRGEYNSWELDNQQANIDYIAMMTDVELPTEV